MCQGTFFGEFDFKNGCETEFEDIITKNHAVDSKIGSLLKIDVRADWTDESIPTAWELINFKYSDGNEKHPGSDGRRIR